MPEQVSFQECDIWAVYTSVLEKSYKTCHTGEIYQPVASQ